MRTPTFLILFLAILAGTASAAGYQQPPMAIAEILDARYPPSVSLSPDGVWMVEMERPALRSLEELAADRVKVAGIKLDPATHGPSRPYVYRTITLRRVDAPKRSIAIELPDEARISGLGWHPDSDKFSVRTTEAEGIALWVARTDGSVQRLTDTDLNATYGSPCDWLPGDQGMVCKRIPADLGPAPSRSKVPAGPRIEENLGRATPTRTYSNLLQNPHDEALFEHYLTSELIHVALDGSKTLLHEAALIDEASPSPDGKWVTVRTLERPFSYQVPAARFPKTTVVFPIAQPDQRTVLAELPLADDIPVPFGSVRTGRRSIGWRGDLPATMWIVEALDGGDAGAEADLRDRVSLLEAPFTTPSTLWESELRFSSMQWGDADTALATEWWYDDRRVRTWRLAPGNPDVAPELIWDRSYQDQYSDPGRPLYAPGPYGRSVLRRTSQGELLLSGRGASPEGVHPFLDRFDLTTKKATRVWRSADPYYETLVAVLDDDASRFVTRRQSKTEPPNMYMRKAGSRRAKALTKFVDWAPQFDEVVKEPLEYTRADGLPLTATLYLPPGYDKRREGPLPTVFWAYPSEFKNRRDAGQKTRADNTFTRPYGSSVLMMLLAGYAVVDDPTIPIVGEGDTEPNDAYIEQLTAGAEAAVKVVVDKGVTDPERCLIGGHSYGAFTAANLLAHTDLFRAGIARSGAYNRSLTPFGFQSEQRTYWEATDTYVAMSPFTHVPKIDEPILLLHGSEDPNSGTYPLQSKRMYAALKGNGAIVRWVELPLEEHSYRARESIGHALWEMIRWADTWVRDAEPR